MKISKIDCWKIRILVTNNHPLNLMKIEGESILELNNFENIKSLTLISDSINIEADPFLFVKDDKLFLFYESKIIGGRGIIKSTWTSDMHNWMPSVTVLTEECHLSFPFVFEDDGEIYMIPETGVLKSIRLYKAKNDSLTEWEFVKTLIQEDSDTKNVDLSFCDSSIFKFEGIYYLFTTIVKNNINELHLYFAESLYSDFKKHPENPIVKSNKYGRNAGSLISHAGELWRVSQDCINSYGENVNISKIIELSSEKYQEEVLMDSLFDRTDPFYSDGAHQLNITKFDNQFVVASDAKGYRRLLMQRLLAKYNNKK